MPRSVSLALALCAALAALAARPARAGDPSLVWKTIESEHFVVHYYEPLDDVARRVAVVAERAHRVLAPAFRHEPAEKTQVVVTNMTDSSNGFARVLPRNTITLYVSSPSGTSALGDYDDWLYLLTAHEYTHILHLDSIGGLASIYNRIFGKSWAPNQVQPRWVIEGLATYQESRRSSGGRIRFSLFDMNLRVATLANQELALDEVSNTPRRWPHGNAAYLYGSHFLDFVFDRYGDEAVSAMTWSYGSSPLPYGLNKSIEEATGRTFPQLYAEWKEYREARYGLQLEAIERAGRREGRRLTFTGEVNFDPRYTDDGKRLVWTHGDGLNEGNLAAMPVGGNQADQTTYAIIKRSGGFDFLSDGSMVVEQTDVYRADYVFQELFYWDVRDGSMTQLTRGVRARDPAVSPDDRQVAFAINRDGRRTLAVMDLRPDAEPEVVWTGEGRFDQAFTPAWSPDGRRIAFSAWRAGGHRDILVVDLDSGEVTELARDRAQDVQPAFDPKGRYLYYSSDRTGIFNLYAYELSTGKTYQVTNVVGCALAPAVSPDGRRIAYQGFDVDGYELYEIAVDPDDWTEAPLYVNDRPDPVAIADDEFAVSAPRPYRPTETLGPHRYTAELAANSFGRALTLRTSGSDIAGHHTYDLAATLGLVHGDLNVGGSYGYHRLWPSLRVALARGIRRRGGVRIDGVNTAFVEERVSGTASVGLPVLREPDGSGNLAIDYDFDYVRDLENQFEHHDPNDQLPVFPETGTLFSGVALRWSYSDVEGFVYALGPQRGNSLSLSLRFDHPALGANSQRLNLGYTWNTYRQLPFSPTSVAALRVAGGWRTSSPRSASAFSLGGVPEQDLVNSVINDLRRGVTGYLRGYKPGSVRGRQYHLANLELRQELVNIERGFSTLPFFVRRLHVAGLVDYGNAFDGPPDFGDFKLSVGAALRLDVVLGYFIPGSLDVGYARGLSEGGLSEFWMLLTGTI